MTAVMATATGSDNDGRHPARRRRKGSARHADWGGSSPNKGKGMRGEWRESKRRGPKPKKKRAKRGARKERDEATTVSPSSSPLVKISSVQCGGVIDNRSAVAARAASAATRERGGGDAQPRNGRGARGLPLASFC